MMKFYKFYSYSIGIFLAVAYIYMQLVVAVKFRHCIINNGLPGLGNATLYGAAQSCLTFHTIFTFALISIAGCLFFWILYRGLFDKAYRRIQHKPWIVVGGLAAMSSLPYISSGNVVLGDGMQFTALADYMRDSITSLTMPYWNFNWYMGSSPFTFYGWLYSLVSGAVSTIIGLDWANKSLFVILHICSAIAATAFIKQICKSTKAAIIGGTIYSISFEHIGRVLIGRSISSLTYAILPLLFFIFALRLNNKISPIKYAALLGIFAAGLGFNHQVDAAMSLLIFGIYGLSQSIELKRFRYILPGTILGGTFAFLICMFWIIPMLLRVGESSAVGKSMNIFKFNIPDYSVILDSLSWPGIFGDKPLFYLGLSGLLLALIGWVYLARAKKYSIPAVSAIAIALTYVQSNRYSVAALLMIGLSAAYGFIFLSKKIKLDSSKILLIIISIIIIDMAPATLQVGYPDNSYAEEFYSSIVVGPGERILDLASDRRTLWSGPITLYGQNEAIFGVALETAPKSVAYTMQIAARMAEQYYDLNQSFNPDWPYFLGVKKIILHPEQKGIAPEKVFAQKKSALGIERNLTVINIKDHSILIGAVKIENFEKPRNLANQDVWLQRLKFESRQIPYQEVAEQIYEMRINRTTASAEKIFVHDKSDNLDGSIILKVHNVQTMPNRVIIDYEITSEGYIQAPYSYNSELAINIDGKNTPVIRSAFETIVFKSPSGHHQVSIYRSVPIHIIILAIISSCTFTACLIIAFRKRI